MLKKGNCLVLFFILNRIHVDALVSNYSAFVVFVYSDFRRLTRPSLLELY